MKIVYRASSLAAVMLLLLSGALAAGADAPADAEPGQAPYIDGQRHTLAARDSTWYHFEFSVLGPGFLCHFIACHDLQSAHGSATIRMPGIARSGLGFEVYAPSQVRDWRKEDPVGRGSPDGEDLVWAGGADASGAWYVRVVNSTGYSIDYHFAIAGSSLVVSRPTIDPAARQPTDVAAWLDAQRAGAPKPAPYTAGSNVNPDKSAEIDGSPHTISPGADLWYIFTFVSDVRLSVRVMGDAGSGLAFEVYAPGQITDWWKEDPLGRGELIGGDPAWTGDPNSSRLRYVRVINRAGRAVDFQLTVAEAQPKAPAPRPFQGY